MTPRGIRLSNPGNIRKSKDKWQGLSADQPDRDFFKFETPVWGIRAMARILIRYQDAYDLSTPSEIIHRWGPPADMNDTDSYVKDVCKRCGWTPMQHIDVQKYEYMRPLIEALIWHENGQQPYSKSQIDEGLRRAGVVAEQKETMAASAAKDPKVIAATIVGTATAAQQVVAQVESIWGTLYTLGLNSHMVLGIIGVAALGVAAWLVLKYAKERREGLA